MFTTHDANLMLSEHHVVRYTNLIFYICIVFPRPYSIKVFCSLSKWNASFSKHLALNFKLFLNDGFIIKFWGLNAEKTKMYKLNTEIFFLKIEIYSMCLLLCMLSTSDLEYMHCQYRPFSNLAVKYGVVKRKQNNSVLC